MHGLGVFPVSACFENLAHLRLYQLVYDYSYAYVQHSNRAGSGTQRPELLQVTVASPTSENPGSHWKVVTEPSNRLVF